MKHLVLALMFSGSAAVAHTFEFDGRNLREGKLGIAKAFDLDVENKGGSVTIEEVEGDEIVFTAHQEGRRDAKLHVDVARHRVRIWMEYPSPSKNARVALLLKVPRTLLHDLNVSTTDDFIAVSGYFASAEDTPRRTIDLRSESGRVSCYKVCGLGRIDVATDGGAVIFRKVIGPAVVRTAGKGIEFWRNIGGHNLKSETGEIVYWNNMGNALLETDHDEIDATDNSGNIDAKTDSGYVRIKNQRDGGVSVRTESGDIQMENPHASFEKLETVSGIASHTPGIPEEGQRSRNPDVVLMCVDDLIRLVENGW